MVPWMAPYPTTNPYGYGIQPSPQPIAQPWQQPQQQGVTKVYGPDSALQIPLAPNSQSQPIFDYNGRQFYVVTTDGAGSKTLETFDYQPHVEQPKPTTGPAYVTREEFDKAIQRIEGKIDGIHGSVQAAADVL